MPWVTINGRHVLIEDTAGHQAQHALGYKHGLAQKRFSPPESEKGKVGGSYHQGYEAGQLDRAMGKTVKAMKKAYPGPEGGKAMADAMARKLSPITWGGK